VTFFIRNCTKPFKRHRWGKWKKVDKGELQQLCVNPLSPNSGSFFPIGTYVVIERLCLDCEMPEYRTVKSTTA
jgi:hypothetical protein